MNDKIFDELKRLQQSQKEALREAITKLGLRNDKPISADEVEELIKSTENLINEKEQFKRSASAAD